MLTITDTTTDADLVRSITTDPNATPRERVLALRLALHLERIAAVDREIAEWSALPA